MKDQDTIGGGIDEGIHASFFVADLFVELGVIDRDSGLVGKGLEQQFIVGGIKVGVTAEDEQYSDDFLVGC